MKLGDGDSGKSNSEFPGGFPLMERSYVLPELAALTGMGERGPGVFPGRENSNYGQPVTPISTFTSDYGTLQAGSSTVNVASRKRTGTTASRPQEPTDDDPIEYQRANGDATGQF